MILVIMTGLRNTFAGGTSDTRKWMHGKMTLNISEKVSLTVTTRGMRVCAWCTHAFTASGVVFGLLAVSAVEQRNWQAVLFWLFIALIIDGIDGPVARKIDIKTVLPRFDGSTLDLLVDYFTFVIVPALMLYRSELLPEPIRFIAAAAVLMSALHHYCNLDIKTEDGYFVGFPAFWNITVFYLYRFPQDPWIATAIVFLLCALTFVPVKVVHPLRVKKFRTMSIFIVLLWLALVVIALARPNLRGDWWFFACMLPLAYFTWISIRRTVIGSDFLVCRKGGANANTEPAL
jgi:phosphatidylcholine synthase